MSECVCVGCKGREERHGRARGRRTCVGVCVWGSLSISLRLQRDTSEVFFFFLYRKQDRLRRRETTHIHENNEPKTDSPQNQIDNLPYNKDFISFFLLTVSRKGQKVNKRQTCTRKHIPKTFLSQNKTDKLAGKRKI